jgi:hypothetical protein
MHDWLSSDWCELMWSPWTPLNDRNLLGIPRMPGLYRVKAIGEDGLVYIGQSGRSVSGRLQQLRAGLFWDEMPFDDPHTATPNLWCLRVEHGAEFEVSGAVFVGDKKDRMALECFLLWQYRLKNGESTLCNFGHFHPSYTKSRNRKSGIRGTRLDETGVERKSMPPLQPKGHPLSSDWMGLIWSEWLQLDFEKASMVDSSPGLYRIMQSKNSLCYVGETTTLRGRLISHLSRFESCWFSYSSVVGLESIQRHELESDLIGAVYAETGTSLSHQFGR